MVPAGFMVYSVLTTELVLHPQSPILTSDSRGIQFAFFGLFALSSTVTAFLAPLMVATITTWFQSQRAGFASLASLMVLGFVMLGWVRQEQAQASRPQPRT